MINDLYNSNVDWFSFPCSEAQYQIPCSENISLKTRLINYIVSDLVVGVVRHSDSDSDVSLSRVLKLSLS